MTRLAARLPSKPGRPVAWHDGGISVTVDWTRPDDDGGTDVTAYVIKYGDEDTKFDDYAAVTVAANTTNFQFTDQLKKDTYYQFVVAAVNSAGQGPFSKFSDYVHTSTGQR